MYLGCFYQKKAGQVIFGFFNGGKDLNWEVLVFFLVFVIGDIWLINIHMEMPERERTEEIMLVSMQTEEYNSRG